MMGPDILYLLVFERVPVDVQRRLPAAALPVAVLPVAVLPAVLGAGSLSTLFQ
jgi:hypothetical protein